MRNFLERYMAKGLKDLNISYTQALILCKLAEMPDKTATQKELKEFLQVISASISTVIKRMIENGLLLQKPPLPTVTLSRKQFLTAAKGFIKNIAAK